jgi:hypothetical protein
MTSATKTQQSFFSHKQRNHNMYFPADNYCSHPYVTSNDQYYNNPNLYRPDEFTAYEHQAHIQEYDEFYWQPYYDDSEQSLSSVPESPEPLQVPQKQECSHPVQRAVPIRKIKFRETVYSQKKHKRPTVSDNKSPSYVSEVHSYMTNSGLNQKQLALKMSCSPSTFSQYMTGKPRTKGWEGFEKKLYDSFGIGEPFVL